MARPVDWSVVGLSGDPVPGDVGVVRAGGQRYVGVAERLGRCAQVLRALEAGASGSESVAGLVEVKDGLVDEALRAEGRYRAAGAALEAYAVVLDRAQVDSLAALQVAVGAGLEVEAAEREGAYWQQRAAEVAGSMGAGAEVPAGAGGVTDPGAEAVVKLGRCQRLVERAEEERRVALGVIAAQREIIAQAVADRDSAARQAIARIEQAGAVDGLADKWWDDWGAPLVKLVSMVAGLVATLAGMLAIVLAFIPFVGPILAAGLLAISGLACLLAALADVTLAISGDGTWGQAAWSIVFAGLSCIGLGSLRTMATNVKGLANAPKIWANTGGLKQLGGTRGLARAYATNTKTAALELRQATIQTLHHPIARLKNAAKALRANHWIAPEKGVEGELRALFARRSAAMTERDEIIAEMEAIMPAGFTISSFSRGKISETILAMRRERINYVTRDRLYGLATRLINTRREITGIGANIGELGGAEQLRLQGARLVDSFCVDTPGGNLLDALALSKDGKTVIVAEFKGVTARLDSTPRPTMFEGSAKQGTAAYTRDRMLTDPRVAQYLADTPTVWEAVASGRMRFQLQIIYTRSPELTKREVLDFSLTPEVLEELSKRVSKLL